MLDRINAFYDQFHQQQADAGRSVEKAIIVSDVMVSFRYDELAAYSVFGEVAVLAWRGKPAGADSYESVSTSRRKSASSRHSSAA